MRQPAFTKVRIDWGSAPVWSSGPATSLFGGDTVIALAGFSRPSQAGAVRLLADDAQGQAVELARSEADAPCPGDSLPRIAAARRIAHSTDRDALALALQYQLISKQTHCILVHQRADADKVAEPALLHRVRSMLAAGWGGIGAVSDGFVDDFSFMSTSGLPPQIPVVKGCLSEPARRVKCIKIATLREAGNDQAPASLKAMAQHVKAHLAQGGSIQNLAVGAGTMTLHADARQALDEVVQLGVSLVQAWLLLAHWTNTRTNGLADAELTQLVEPLVTATDPELAAVANHIFERDLGSHGVHVWNASRVERLLRALGRNRS
jgi:hypothetical protein